jgi:hypothetical protein
MGALGAVVVGGKGVGIVLVGVTKTQAGKVGICEAVAFWRNAGRLHANERDNQARKRIRANLRKRVSGREDQG